MKEINIQDLITHKLASPIHALKFYSEEKTLSGDDILPAVDILESILDKSRFIFSFNNLEKKNWNDYLKYIHECSFFLSPTGEKILSYKINIDGVINNKLKLDQYIFNIMNFAKIKGCQISIEQDDRYLLFKFSNEVSYSKDEIDQLSPLEVVINENNSLIAIKFDKIDFTK